jgi:hypothetical protein
MFSTVALTLALALAVAYVPKIVASAAFAGALVPVDVRE